MRVTIDIDERFSKILSFTAIKSIGLETNVSVGGVDLENGTYLKIDAEGKFHQSHPGMIVNGDQ